MKASTFKVLIIFTVLTILGVFLLQKLPLKLNPSNTDVSITVSYTWPNASPNILERDVTSKLEANFATLNGLKKITSRSSKGYGSIDIEFDKHVDIDIARFEVSAKIREISPQIPKEISYPNITVNRPDGETTREFLSFNIKAPENPSSIRNFVETQIQPIIGSVPGVDRTEIYGARPHEVVIVFDKKILKSLNLTEVDITSALKQVFKRKDLGIVTYGKNEYLLTLNTGLKIKDWHIPIKKVRGRLIFLNQIASIKTQEQEATKYYRINGDNAIAINVYSNKQANTIALVEEIEHKLKKIQLPSEYFIIKAYDSTKFLKQELSKIYKRSLYTLLALVIFILIVSKSFKYLTVLIISLTVNLCLAFLLYFLFNVEIQLYSLAGITISLGLVIDNSIVMINHFRSQNNKSIIVAILASTLTTIGALSIIIFLDNQHKANLLDFATVIIINLSVSLIITFFLIPALMDLFNPKSKKKTNGLRNQIEESFYKIYKKYIYFGIRFKKIAVLFIVILFGLPLFLLPQKLESNGEWYQNLYNTTLGNDWYRENIRPSVDKYLGGSLKLFSNNIYENAHYQKNEETRLYIIASLQDGATIHQMNEVFLNIEHSLNQYNEIDKFTTNLSSKNYGEIEITFKEDLFDKSFPIKLKSSVVDIVSNIGGVEWSIYGIGNGYTNRSNNGQPIDFSLKAKGYSYKELSIWTDSLKKTLEGHPRIQNVTIKTSESRKTNPTYEYKFSLDKQHLALNKITASELLDKLKSYTLTGNTSTSYIINGKHTPFRLQSTHLNKFDVWHIKNYPIDSLNKSINLKNIADFFKEKQEESIYKENQEYIKLIQFQYTGSIKFGDKFLNETISEINNKLPLGYTFENQKMQRFYNQKKDNDFIFLLLMVSGIIFIICSILFESLKQPFIILSIVPISFIGVFLTFYLFDFNFDQGGLASFVLLSGLSVNASIFIVEEYNKTKKQFPYYSNVKVYLEAFKLKIFPITLTIISTILSFIPFIMDGQNEVFWFALGVGTIGGLIFSMIGILFYLPLFTLKKTNTFLTIK